MKTKTIEQLLLIEPYITDEAHTWLSERPKPTRICGKRVPETLNDLTFGELVSIQSQGSTRDMIVDLARSVLRLRHPDRILHAPCDDVIGFLRWVSREVDRINKMFTEASRKPNADEISAGVLDLNFGVFGTLDWYARRMGYRDQNEVLGVKWVRIYECTRMDAERDEYESRLREIIATKNRK